MIQKRPFKVFTYVRWKKKDSIAVFLIIVIGLLMTSIGFFFTNFYDIFISLCLGFFIGGLVLSIISTFLAQMESNIMGTGEIDAEVDIDIDADVDAEIDIDTDIDAEIDIDTDIDADADVDYDIEAEIDVDVVDVDAEVDVEAGVDVDSELELDTEAEFDSGFISTITPAPIMLLFSTAFLVYGISGIALYYILGVDHKYIIFFAAPVISYFSVKLINFLWKILAKSRYYRISSTMNLIGMEGEVILQVDERGGVIKISSNTPMKFERLHVKPLREEKVFARGERVYVCSVKNGYLLVDNSLKAIRKKRRLN
ncbi:MAG: hypothetical protein ACFE8B_11445 [Candidatus Hermodarchaeota archaeon]